MCHLFALLGSLTGLLLLAAAAFPGPGTKAPEDYTKVDPEKLGVKPVPSKKDPVTGFLVGGKNTTARIRKLTEIAGRKIADLEKDMRPRKLSNSGFLGADEKLLEVLSMDNAYVVDQLGLTHQELARPLRFVGAIALRFYEEAAKGGRQPGYREFLYHGRKYKVKAMCYRGYQKSPFADGTKTNCNATLWNLTNNKKLDYSLLVPEMIERYGFYEGKGTPYRVEPRAILEVLDFLKPAKGS